MAQKHARTSTLSASVAQKHARTSTLSASVAQKHARIVTLNALVAQMQARATLSSAQEARAVNAGGFGVPSGHEAGQPEGPEPLDLNKNKSSMYRYGCY